MLTTKQINEIKELLEQVGAFQLQEQLKVEDIQSHEKGLNQLVSYVDIESERMLVSGLSKITPAAGFITEEDTIDRSTSALQWIIDPLDGTTNFLFGHQQFAISIALQNKGVSVYGGIYIPHENKLYHAQPDGAFINGKPLSIIERKTLSNSLIATGFPYYKFEEIDQYLDILKQLMQETKGLRRMGSAAIDLAYTAEGKFDGFFELNLSPWDVAAGAYIVQQSGGHVQDFSGGDDYVFGNSILAGSKDISALLLKVISSHFN